MQKMTKEQEALFRELKSLAKLANQRILRLERTVKHKPMIVSQLEEKLSTEVLQAISPKGRVRVSKKFTPIQMKAIIKELKSFKASPFTTARGRKKVHLTGGITGLVETQGIRPQEAEGLLYIFEDKEVNKITNFIKGSEIIALIQGAIEEKDEYEIFRQRALDAVRYNKGKSCEQLLKKIYVKYISKENANDIEIVNKYIMDMIYYAKWREDLQDIENIINEYKNQKRISQKEYNYLIGKLREKEYEITDGL